MDARVLVAYANKYVATAEMAEKIAETLRGASLRTEVQPLDRLRDLAPYGAVVLGSAVYVGQWQKKAAAFLQANETTLTQRAVWLFSSGPTGKGDPAWLMKGWRFPETLQAVADRIRPRDIALFRGAIDMGRVALPEKLIIKALKAPTGDFRDWSAIAV